MAKKVDIIVVNWNAGEKTLRAVLPYLNYESSVINCNVIIVDNASIDNSTTILKKDVKKIIKNDINVGFGKACNQAFYGSDADYILLLNPDTISNPFVLEKLVEFLEKNQDYAVVGPSQVDENKNVLRTCGRFPIFKTSLFEILGLSKMFPTFFTSAPIMKDWDHLQSRDVDHVMGSYMLIRKSILDRVGFMDEDYFVYFEDLDLSKRINDIGFKTFYHHKYSIIHEGGGTGQRIEEYRLFYSLYSRFIYWKKHLRKTSCFILTAFSITVEPPFRVVDSIMKSKKFRLKKIGKAYFLYLRKIISG